MWVNFLTVDLFFKYPIGLLWGVGYCFQCIVGLHFSVWRVVFIRYAFELYFIVEIVVLTHYLVETGYFFGLLLFQDEILFR